MTTPADARGTTPVPEPTAKPQRKPRRPRRGISGESDTPFSQRAQDRGRDAVRAYYVSVYGLIPVLGAVLGPIALLLGVLSRYRHRNEPAFKGRSLANAAMVFGGALWVTNWAGLALIVLWYLQP